MARWAVAGAPPPCEDLVKKATREVVGALVREAAKAAEEAQKAGRALEANEKFNVRTYDAIVKVARAQVSAFNENGEDGRFSDRDIRECFAAAVSEPDEAKDLDGVINKLGTMVKRYPENAPIYEAAITTMKGTLASLKESVVAKANREDFIAKAVAAGHDAESAAAFYDMPKMAVPVQRAA